MLELEADNIALVHLAPPCGTASAARSRDLPRLRAAGGHVPQPLRSVREPQGIGTLSGADLLRVQQANLLYAVVGRVAAWCVARRIRVSVENPLNSLAWLCDGLDDLLRIPASCQVVFAHCAHGGRRDKLTRWWCSDDLFQSLEARCSREHDHDSWQLSFAAAGRARFPTADEAAYPLLLCERIASLLAENYPTLHLQNARQPRSGAQVYLDKQPRFAPQMHKLDAFEVVTSESPENTCRGHETIEKEEDQFNVVGLIHSNFAICADRAELLTVAIPKEPDDFVRDAVKAGHPRNLLAESRKGVAKEVAKKIVMSKDERDKVAKPCLERWAATKKATECAGQELMSKAPEYIQRASNGKNVLLWKAILEECDFPDKDLWQALHQGFRITGWMPDTGLFVKNVRPPVMSIDELLSQSRYRTPATLRSIENEEADEAAFGAWKETLSELEAGWLFIDENPNPVEIIVARRFGLQQKNKLRVIDDGKMCGLNLTCGLPERFTLHGVDVIAGALLEALALAEDGGMALRGKTYDLVSAYKFYPLHPEDRARLRIAVKDVESGGVAVYGSNVLVFGATGSVAGFLRISAAIWKTGHVGGAVPWTAYFDDFPTIVREGCEDQVDAIVDELFGLLNVEYAREGRKATKFGETFSALGLLFDLGDSQNGNITIRHTDERRQELVHVVEHFLETGHMTPKEAEALRGRLHWFNSYLFGRASCDALHLISKRALAKNDATWLNGDLRWALCIVKEYMETAKPLTLTAAAGRTMYLFTDGSYEPDSDMPAGIGGILYDEAGNPIFFYSGQVHHSDLQRFLEDSHHPIYEIELYAVVMAFRIWGDLLRNSYSVVYLDNEAAQAALISGTSGTGSGRRLLGIEAQLEGEIMCRPWFGRVASHSNPSDDPSRGVFDHLVRRGVQRSQIAGPIL